MIDVLTEEERVNFLKVSKFFLSYLGENVEELHSHIPARELHVSTVNGIINKFLLSSLAKANKEGLPFANKLAEIFEASSKMDPNKKETFTYYLNGLEEVTSKHLLF